MGVDISKLVEPAPLRLEDLSGRALAIDAFNTLYQFIATIRQPDGTPNAVIEISPLFAVDAAALAERAAESPPIRPGESVYLG